MIHLTVRVPIVHPVPARAGDVLVVRPGDPAVPIAVVRQGADGRWRGVRRGPPNFGALAGYLADGVVTPRSPRAADAVHALSAS